MSYEPALGPVDWTGWEWLNGLICGGESGHGARPMNPAWARAARDFCVKNSIPYFFKQWGEWAPIEVLKVNARTTFKHKPVQIGNELLFRVGKGFAGHLLDGIEWRQMP